MCIDAAFSSEVSSFCHNCFWSLSWHGFLNLSFIILGPISFFLFAYFHTLAIRKASPKAFIRRGLLRGTIYCSCGPGISHPSTISLLSLSSFMRSASRQSITVCWHVNSERSTPPGPLTTHPERQWNFLLVDRRHQGDNLLATSHRTD